MLSSSRLRSDCPMPMVMACTNRQFSVTHSAKGTLHPRLLLQEIISFSDVFVKFFALAYLTACCA